MYKFFSISLALRSPLNQEQIRELFRHEGCDSVQTSHGICVKTQLDDDAIRTMLSKNGMKDGYVLCELHAVEAHELGKDVVAFMNS
jgi:uncharacterized protein YneF (UPF0154 family)